MTCIWTHDSDLQYIDESKRLQLENHCKTDKWNETSRVVNAVTVVKAFDLYLIYDYYGKRFQAAKKGL